MPSTSSNHLPQSSVQPIDDVISFLYIFVINVCLVTHYLKITLTRHLAVTWARQGQRCEPPSHLWPTEWFAKAQMTCFKSISELMPSVHILMWFIFLLWFFFTFYSLSASSFQLILFEKLVYFKGKHLGCFKGLQYIKHISKASGECSSSTLNTASNRLHYWAHSARSPQPVSISLKGKNW